METPTRRKVALVTGASKGIGLAIAKAFAEAGARVMLSSRKQEALEAAAAGIDGETEVFAANAGDPEQAEACVAATVERFGGLDILVNNAATNPYMGPAIDIDLPRYDKTFEVNLRGPLVWTQLAWRAGHEGSAAAWSSTSRRSAASASAGRIGTYDNTKAALIHLTKHLAVELAPQGAGQRHRPRPGEDRLRPGPVGAGRGGGGAARAAEAAGRARGHRPRRALPRQRRRLVDHRRGHGGRRRRAHLARLRRVARRCESVSSSRAWRRSPRPSSSIAFAEAADDGGFASMWLGEHVVLFDEYESQYPYSGDGKIGVPAESGMLDCYRRARASSPRAEHAVRIGTAVCLLPQRNPVATAKEVATVDWLSGGRLDVGIGVGWLREEFEALDASFDDRAGRCREYVEVMRTLWCDEVSSFEGDSYRLPACRMYPKPVQRPHPPFISAERATPPSAGSPTWATGGTGSAISPTARRSAFACSSACSSSGAVRSPRSM